MNRYWGQLTRGRDEAEAREQRRRAKDRRRSWLMWYAGWTIIFMVLFVVIG